MPLPLTLRNPELADRIRHAYERAQAARGGLGGAAIGAVGAGDRSAGLGALDLAVTTARESSSRPGSGFEQIANPETRTAFETSFEATEQLFARLGIPIPTPEQLTGSGIDLAYLASAYEQMAADCLEPHIVLAPSMSKDEARQLYHHLTNDTSIPDNPLKPHNSTDTNSDGIWISNTITDAVWHDLHDPSINPLANAIGIGNLVPIYTDTTHTPHTWSLRIIQGTAAPSNLGKLRQYHGNPSISETLTMQAIRIQAGLAPVDNGPYSSWNNGIFNNKENPRTPYSRWNTDCGQVHVSWNGPSSLGPYLGSRSSVG